ncbi:hypothetical protein PIB30_073926 [Stylosanthes scabra]|uniref:Uncharacterized protein n=1 Tax=Stylosanthes scabra TaxID=79078 RepID=A0ABU6YM47_9FABA|nr:hypothetical protein [Stylosanthes scabra]
MKQLESLKEVQSLTGSLAALSSATNPGQAGKGKAFSDLLSRHRRNSGRSLSSRKRKGAGTCILREQNPPRSGAEIPETREVSLRPHRGHQKASTVFSGPLNRGKDRATT